ncbi:Glycosyl hydrolases family 2, sugar binding domain [Hyunsoonleella jejuensis]|uniref:Glycosyl hydrolases family 2, sugar binding domain n=1 Tax=Hyunsoonleella jejuensis TaxID=419940 RepID=A0A1H9IWV0_9FLAO|nr:glycosyl hydrolase [Hyunsoonleella jejuensis]SEQ79016.1 Glycosyl hydrolases family 2, sugar binding domain [Hyunsoonleella jejuensis]
MKQSLSVLLFCFLSIYFSVAQINQKNNENLLHKGFQNPPNQAKARTWWHWISGNVSKSGITKDLEAMKAVGIQEAQLFNVHLGFPQGPVKYLSEEWLDLFEFSAKEAKRLGLELAFHNSAGWSSSGGPWVTKENAMQTVVFSKLELQGNQIFKGELPKPKTKFNYYQDIAVLAFPKPKTHIKIDGLDYKNLSERIRNHLLPDDKEISKDAIVQKEDILDLTSKFNEDDGLEWNVPKGEWVILRLGHTPIGTTNRPAPPEAKGLEVDKMSKKALDAYWEGGIQPIIDRLGDLVGTTVNNCLIDSYEVETTNWTSGFDAQFQALRGYDLTTYLPILAGYYVDSGEVSERFLWDFRRTIGDLIAENYYAHFAELCHKNGMKFSVEPYWGPFDNMQVGATGDIVMCEFWSGGYPFFDSPKFVSSIAHLNGSAIVGAESFTGIGGWDKHPANIKSIGDRAWAEGITRFIFHTYVHQPWDVAPGLALSYHGFDFNRLNTWWKQSKGYMDYIARSQYLLQQGKNVADVLVFTGESSPNTGFIKPEIREMGFDYDLIGANKLKDLTAKDGTIYSSVGNRYNLLVLPESDFIKPETLQKVKELVDGGAKVIGKKPMQSPSLTNYPNCDEDVTTYVDALWGSGLVKDMTIEQALSDTTPDFKIETSDSSDLSFIHRKTDNADIYFIANARKEAREITSRFRVVGKQPELWNSEKGTIKDVVVFKENEDGTTTVPLSLGMEESVFVVFKKPVNSNHLLEVSTELELSQVEPLSNLEIIKAEYGTFLQEGLIDITDRVNNAIDKGVLDFKMTRMFCDCDPAMGYKKEFRMEYQIGDVKKQIYAEEREHIHIDAGDKSLKVLKAVFGKFKGETTGIPQHYKTFDVTKTIKNIVNSGTYNILVSNELIDNKIPEGDKTVLKISYKTDGEERTMFISKGQFLKLSKDVAKPKLEFKNDAISWTTPYAGKINYKTASGATKTAEVTSVSKPMVLSGAWEVSFPINSEASKKETFPSLISWTDVQDETIQHFSGTASYKKGFVLSEEMIQRTKSVTLDLGSVSVIAEVIVNGNNIVSLWKAPFRVNIDGFVKEGKNSLEVKVTNLWPNRLIGDEKLKLDYPRQGKRAKPLPDWLLNHTERPSKRTTFASWNHYSKNDDLLKSGLLGPVKIIFFDTVKLESNNE